LIPYRNVNSNKPIVILEPLRFAAQSSSWGEGSRFWFHDLDSSPAMGGIRMTLFVRNA
jgi:hypothetical protein